MNKPIFTLVILAMSLFAGVSSQALEIGENTYPSSYVCWTHSNGVAFCKYTGVISRIFVNSANVALVYFDGSNFASQDGWAAYNTQYGPIPNNRTNAASIDLNSAYGKYMLMLAINSKMLKKPMTIRVRGAHANFPKALSFVQLD